MKGNLVLIGIFFITIASCNVKRVDIKAEGERLMQVSRDWSRAAASDSIDKVLSYWADDAIVMSPGQPTIKGKDAIRKMVEESSKIPGFKISWEPLTVEVANSRDMAYLIEQNKITVTDSSGKPITEYNKAVTIWRKETDGTWKNIVDTWNSEPARKN